MTCSKGLNYDFERAIYKMARKPLKFVITFILIHDPVCAYKATKLLNRIDRFRVLQILKLPCFPRVFPTNKYKYQNSGQCIQENTCFFGTE